MSFFFLADNDHNRLASLCKAGNITLLPTEALENVTTAINSRVTLKSGRSCLLFRLVFNACLDAGYGHCSSTLFSIFTWLFFPGLAHTYARGGLPRTNAAPAAVIRTATELDGDAAVSALRSVPPPAVPPSVVPSPSLPPPPQRTYVRGDSFEISMMPPMPPRPEPSGKLVLRKPNDFHDNDGAEIPRRDLFDRPLQLMIHELVDGRPRLTLIPCHGYTIRDNGIGRSNDCLYVSLYQGIFFHKTGKILPNARLDWAIIRSNCTYQAILIARECLLELESRVSTGKDEIALALSTLTNSLNEFVELFAREQDTSCIREQEIEQQRSALQMQLLSREANAAIERRKKLAAQIISVIQNYNAKRGKHKIPLDNNDLQKVSQSFTSKQAKELSDFVKTITPTNEQGKKLKGRTVLCEELTKLAEDLDEVNRIAEKKTSERSVLKKQVESREESFREAISRRQSLISTQCAYAAAVIGVFSPELKESLDRIFEERYAAVRRACVVPYVDRQNQLVGTFGSPVNASHVALLLSHVGKYTLHSGFFGELLEVFLAAIRYNVTIGIVSTSRQGSLQVFGPQGEIAISREEDAGNDTARQLSMLDACSVILYNHADGGLGQFSGTHWCCVIREYPAIAARLRSNLAERSLEEALQQRREELQAAERQFAENPTQGTGILPIGRLEAEVHLLELCQREHFTERNIPAKKALEQFQKSFSSPPTTVRQGDQGKASSGSCSVC